MVNSGSLKAPFICNRSVKALLWFCSPAGGEIAGQRRDTEQDANMIHKSTEFILNLPLMPGAASVSRPRRLWCVGCVRAGVSHCFMLLLRLQLN